MMIAILSFLALLASAQAFPKPTERLYAAPLKVAANTPFSLSKTLGDHMVLQRDTVFNVWGFAPPGTTVKTSFAGKQYSATAGSDTIWRQQLPPTPANKAGQVLSFSASTGEAAQLNDVLFGDVYICSGQSNMQFSIPANTNSSAEAADASNYPAIRIFTVGQGTSSKTPLNDLQTISQLWAVASNTSISGGGGACGQCLRAPDPHRKTPSPSSSILMAP
jgi:sialate O-acetylesterase